MSGELSTLAKQQPMLLQLMEEVKQLHALLKAKDGKIAGLERRIDDLEQYSRMDDVIISGLRIKPRSYARAAAAANSGTDDPSPEEQQTTEEQVIKFFESQAKPIHLDAKSIVACHPLPRKDKTAIPAIIVRFGSRKQKDELLKQRKNLQGTDVFLNEHLTKRNAEIAKEARKLKKDNKIQFTWTRTSKC